MAAERGVFHERWKTIGPNGYWERDWAVEPGQCLSVLQRKKSAEGGDRTRTTRRSQDFKADGKAATKSPARELVTSTGTKGRFILIEKRIPEDTTR